MWYMRWVQQSMLGTVIDVVYEIVDAAHQMRHLVYDILDAKRHILDATYDPKAFFTRCHI